MGHGLDIEDTDKNIEMDSWKTRMQQQHLRSDGHCVHWTIGHNN